MILLSIIIIIVVVIGFAFGVFAWMKAIKEILDDLR